MVFIDIKVQHSSLYLGQCTQPPGAPPVRCLFFYQTLAVRTHMITRDYQLDLFFDSF